MILWGLDPGTHTGIARWDIGRADFTLIQTVKIHVAMDMIRQSIPSGSTDGLVLFEDARLRRWGFHDKDEEQAKYGAGVREGAGAAKRDATMWDDALADWGIPFLARHPRKKLDALLFASTTGHQGRTSQHARDAGMLVFNHTAPLFQSLLTEYRGKREASEHPQAIPAHRRGRGRGRSRFRAYA